MTLSIVAVGSNAQYGGNFIERMQAWADNLFTLAPECKLDADVIIVEWAPPLDRPSIKDSIDWTKQTLPVTIITVPYTVHNLLSNPHRERFFEYWAKNVGIRRATGEAILSTNPDNIYSGFLLSRLARSPVPENQFYRVNRYDIRDGKVFSINRANGSTINDGRADPAVCPDLDGQFEYPGLGKRSLLHFNASGDFILMSRENWFKIAGHPEVPYSLTVDGQTVYLAAKAGLEQVILPEPMYHQDHTRSEKYCPSWSDRTPYGTKNEDGWGLKNAEFNTSYI